jgi:peptidoglycan/xylan/chitin deacetylase (PgdA/CDA1 family)|tara:strand:+ start:24 stop:395 length:372 start_codon:yes stop_codon:yes gene_type:complete
MKESEKLLKKEIDYHRYWKEQYEKERKLRQEVENEIVLIKGITITNSPELRAANSEINDLKNKIANLEETVKSKDYFRDPDYQFLIGENNRLEQERNELLLDNKKLAQQVDDKINQLRRSGVL